MNRDRNNAEYVQKTFEELHAPTDLRRKVMNMNKENKSTLSRFKKVIVAAALAAFLFAGSNGLVYAVTGNTIFGIIMINGVTQNTSFEIIPRPDGLQEFYTTVDTPEGPVAMLIIDDSGSIPQAIVIDTVTDTPAYNVAVVEEETKIFFTHNEIKIDITEDIADGHSIVSYELDGVAYKYDIKTSSEAANLYEIHLVEDKKETPIGYTSIGTLVEDGQTYFAYDENKLDITEDMMDGHAIVSVEKDGWEFIYEIKELPEAPGYYEIHLIEEKPQK